MTTADKATDLDLMGNPIIPDSVKRAREGRKTAIICRARFDAKAKSEAFYHKHCRGWDERFVLRGCAIEHLSGGVIEFCWIESHTGRRADDFDDRAFAL